HGERFFSRGGTVVQARQNMTVQVNHSGPPSSPPCAKRLPRAKREQNPRKNLPHPLRLQLFCQPSSHDAAQEHSRDQQQSGFPGKKAYPRISHQRKHPRRRNQRHQTRPLRLVLAESIEQAKQRHQQHPAANPKHPRSNSANARHQENPRVPPHALTHGRPLPRLQRACLLAAPSSKARWPKAPKSSQTALSSGAKPAAGPQGFPHTRQEESPARTGFPRSNPLGLASNTLAKPQARWAAAK